MEGRKIKVVQTARDTDDRLKDAGEIVFMPDADGHEGPLVNIYDDVVYQEIEGFGGAFTEAAAVTADKMSPARREEILNAYFNPVTGLGYSLCRTHINSCDFSLGNYAYAEAEKDVNLESFTLDRDRKSLIPFIKDAIAVEGAAFKLFSSPWSPPAWMKTTGMMNRGGRLKDEYREVWAGYFARYIQEYDREGIKIWGVTVQNEPKAVQSWDSCIFTAEEERDFVKFYLGPTLEKEGLGHVKIMIWDHNKERVYERSRTAYSDPEASRYIWGAGFHWYSGDHFESLEALHHMFPDKRLIFTEGCQEGGVKLGSWDTGERYGHDIMGDLNNWTNGWVDWNMVLDEKGGPNHVHNYCDAPIIADTKNDKIIYESSYYYLGHFSKFIRPGSRRIACSRFTDKLETTAFKTPEGKFVVVVLNRTDNKIPFYLRHDECVAKTVSLPHSIVTYVY